MVFNYNTGTSRETRLQLHAIVQNRALKIFDIRQISFIDQMEMIYVYGTCGTYGRLVSRIPNFSWKDYSEETAWKT
jgi:hypothetical protein